MSARSHASKFNLLPKGYIARWNSVGGVLTEYIGLSVITLTTGTADDLIAASWPFPDTDATRQIDTLLGGDALFDSANGMAKITRFGYDWAALDNVDYFYVGYNGIVAYTESMSTEIDRIIRVLQLPAMMSDTLVMLDNLRMVR